MSTLTLTYTNTGTNTRTSTNFCGGKGYGKECFTSFGDQYTEGNRS